MAIKLVEDGNQFLLTDTSGYVARLSEEDILGLAHSIQYLTNRIVEGHTPRTGTVSPILATPVGDIALNTDLHRSTILLTMFDGEGSKISAFALLLATAKPLAQKLTSLVAEIEETLATKSEH